MNKLIFTLLCFITISAFSCKSTEVKNATDEIKTEEALAEDEEFSRSTQDVLITKETFYADKAAILQIISELSDVMAKHDFNAWLTYIEPESIEYWSSPRNLLQASKRLPYKNKRLNTLNDYFDLVFVPSRKGRQIDEIRYISVDSVKAVQMQEEQDIVYYNFIKMNGKWMVKIPPLQQQ